MAKRTMAKRGLEMGNLSVRIKNGSWLFISNLLHKIGDISPWFVRKLIFQIQGLSFLKLNCFLKFHRTVCVDKPLLAYEAEDRGCAFSGVDFGIRRHSWEPLLIPLEYTTTIECWGRVFGSGLQNDEPCSFFVQVSR